MYITLINPFPLDMEEVLIFSRTNIRLWFCFENNQKQYPQGSNRKQKYPSQTEPNMKLVFFLRDKLKKKIIIN